MGILAGGDNCSTSIKKLLQCSKSPKSQMPMFYSQLSAILGAEGCHPLLPPQSGGVCLFIIYSHSKYKLVQYSVKYLVYNIQYSVIYILARAGGGGGGAPINSASCR